MRLGIRDAQDAPLPLLSQILGKRHGVCFLVVYVESKFLVHNKIQGKVQGFPLYFLPHPHGLPSIPAPPSSGVCVIADEPALAWHRHPGPTAGVRAALRGVCSVGLGRRARTRVHCCVRQSGSPALGVCSTCPSRPGPHRAVRCLCRFASPTGSRGWDQQRAAWSDGISLGDTRSRFSPSLRGWVAPFPAVLSSRPLSGQTTVCSPPCRGTPQFAKVDPVSISSSLPAPHTQRALAFCLQLATVVESALKVTAAGGDEGERKV